MDDININLPRKNVPVKNPAPVNTSVKTIYLDASGKTGFKNSILGIVLMFFCIFAVCIGLIMCVSQSFTLEIDFFAIFIVLTVSLAFFTFIYYLPSGFLTFAAFLAASGAFAVYVVYNLDFIAKAAYYTLNLCLYKINQEGYIIGSIVEYDLARTSNETTESYLFLMSVFAAVLLAAVFSFLVYSKRNIIYSVIISVGIVFPGFFYGLIPSYFAFSLVAAFWVSQFAVNMFESGYMEYIIGRENTVPENRLAKKKFKTFKKEYKNEVKSLKSEIAHIVKSPNRNENLMKLDRLARRLESISKSNRLFYTFYGLGELRKKKRPKQNKTAKKSEKFLNPVQIERLRLKQESKNKKEAHKSAVLTEKKEFAEKPFSARLKIKFENNLSAKRKYSLKGGYAGFFAFIVAFAAISVVQPFIAPDAKMDLAMPEAIMNFLTSTVEYTLVGSDSSVYGGYTGGMGGGSLYRPEGAKFKNKPILKVTSAQNSNVMYLKGWTGNIYTGRMWREADKKQIETYNNLKTDSPFRNNFVFMSEKMFFNTFTESMQNVFEASFQKRSSELKRDTVNIEHLVSGGKRSFLPYFTQSYESESFNFRTTADLSVEVTNSLFRYPAYTANFLTVDNVLNRSMPYAVEDLKEYLDYYHSRANVSPDSREFLSSIDPLELLYIMPDIKFFSEQNFYAMGDRTFDRLNGEGTFYEYSAQSYVYDENPEYHGYLYIPYKYDPYLDIVNVNSNFRNSEKGHNIGSVFTSSEIMYSKFVKDHYLEIPENMPQEIAELAKAVTEGLVSDYEKALAIEKYIAENYTYTLNPVMPLDPRGDYVYNFLFDIKEGYCTAYASSMVMLLRTLGIPARYAEGYLVDTSKKQRDKEGKEFIIVYDYDGHAWPEVYLRGIGWIPFEPTVSYSGEEETEAPPYIYTPPPRLPEAGSASMTPEESEIEEDEEIPIEKPKLPWIFYAAAALIFAYAAVYAANRIIVSNRFKNFKTASANAAVLHMLAYILNFLRHCGFVIHNGEGLRAFSRRIASNFDTIKPSGWDNIALIMQKARYSKHEISDEERQSVFEFIENLRKECLKNLKSNLKFKLRFVYFLI